MPLLVLCVQNSVPSRNLDRCQLRVKLSSNGLESLLDFREEGPSDARQLGHLAALSSPKVHNARANIKKVGAALAKRIHLGVTVSTSLDVRSPAACSPKGNNVHCRRFDGRTTGDLVFVK